MIMGATMRITAQNENTAGNSLVMGLVVNRRV